MTDERGGRYFREARFFLAGDKVAAQSHILEARSLMGYMRDMHALGGPPIQVKYATLQDGTQIKATMMNGQYQAEIVSQNPALLKEEVYIEGLYVVSAVDGLMRVFAPGDVFTGPIATYGNPADLLCITRNLPTYRKLDTTNDVRFCKMQFGTGTYPTAITRPDGRHDLGANDSGFARYCSARYSYTRRSIVSPNLSLVRTKGQRLVRPTDTPYPVLSTTDDHSMAENELAQYFVTQNVSLFIDTQTDSWLRTPVGDVVVVYWPGQYDGSGEPTQTEIDPFCFRVFAGALRADLVYERAVVETVPTPGQPQDLPLVARSPWYTSLRGETSGVDPIWGGPVDHVFKPNASGTRASIVLYTPAHYKTITTLAPPVANTQLVHMDISGTYETPSFAFTAVEVDKDVIAVDYRGDTLVMVGYAAFTKMAGLSTPHDGLWSSDDWLDEPLAAAIYDLDIRAHACLFSTRTVSATTVTLETYFILEDKKVRIEHPALSWGVPVASSPSVQQGIAIDPIPFFFTKYTSLPATDLAGDTSGPTFILLPGGRALIFIRPMFYYLFGYNNGDVGHCQILLYKYADNSLLDVTEQLIPNVGDLPYGDHLYPPWLDFGFVDEISANLQALPVPTP